MLLELIGIERRKSRRMMKAITDTFYLGVLYVLRVSHSSSQYYVNILGMFA